MRREFCTTCPEQDWRDICVPPPDHVRECAALAAASSTTRADSREILGFTAGKIDNKSSRFFGNDPLAPRTRTVVESLHDAELFGPPQASLDRLMRHAEGSTHRVKGRRLEINEQDPRPLGPAHWFRPRTRKPRQLRHILPCKRQLDHSTWSCHDPIRLVQQITEQGYKHRDASTESPAYERIQGIDLLEEHTS